MAIVGLSSTIVTDKIVQCRDFYVEVFGGRVEFDCGWYASVVLAEGACVHFMAPRGPDARPYPGDGLVYNLRVDDVDAEHERIVGIGLPIVSPLQDNPWGDRSFAIQDPAGVTLYVYTEIEPSEEFQSYFK